MIHASEVQIDRTRNACFGESPVFEIFADTPGELFRSCVREHGRCISSVYVDTKDGATKRIGWVFLKRSRYEDTGEPFLLETWITLHEREPITTRQEFPLDLDAAVRQ